MDIVYQLPHDFLSSPTSDVKKQLINFKETELPEYKGYYACILDNVLSVKRKRMANRNRQVSISGPAAKIYTEILELVGKPEITGKGYLKKDWTYRATGANERMRFLKHLDGNYFNPHLDANFATEEGKEVSFITMHLYLNEPDEESQLQGDTTTFHAMDWTERHVDVIPKVGRVLRFQQRSLLHFGADVARGIKYTMRTDLMYRRSN
ncbi:MAG: hypothetical protein Q9201_005903 [Fulgogasparrea decipioides]